MTNTCKTCQSIVPPGAFWMPRSQRCGECQKKVLQKRERSRALLPDRVAAREAYNKSERGRAIHKVAARKWAKENADKRAAHVILGNAVWDGRIEKPVTCRRCGGGGKIHAHHDDYAQPLKVEWVCTTCHRLEHKENHDA